MTSSKILTELTEPMPSSSQKHLCPKPCKLVISGEFKTMMMKVWLVIPWVAPDETEKKIFSNMGSANVWLSCLEYWIGFRKRAFIQLFS